MSRSDPDKPRRRSHRRPTAKQLDERVVIPLDPEQAIKAIMETGPNRPEEEKSEPDKG
jgi:hypothetical protein